MVGYLVLIIRVLIAGISFIALLASSNGGPILGPEYSIWFSSVLAPSMLLFTFAKHGLENFYFLERKFTTTEFRLFTTFLLIYGTILIFLILINRMTSAASIHLSIPLVGALALTYYASHFIRANNRPILSVLIDTTSVPSLFAILSFFNISDFLFYFIYLFLFVFITITLKFKTETASQFSGQQRPKLDKFPYFSRNFAQIGSYIILSIVSATSGWGLITMSSLYLEIESSADIAAILRAGAIITFGQGALTSYFAPIFSSTYATRNIIGDTLLKYRSIALFYAFTAVTILVTVTYSLNILEHWFDVTSLPVVLFFVAVQVFNVMIGPVLFITNLTGNESVAALGSILSTVIGFIILQTFGPNQPSSYILCSAIQTGSYTIFCYTFLSKRNLLK